MAAAEVAERAIQCRAELSGTIRLVEPYKAFNNYVIAAFRAGRMPAAQAAEVLGVLFSGTGEVQRLDRSLVATNFGAERLLAGDTGGACELLERTYARLLDDHSDGYYLLFAASNLAAGRHLTGRTGEAQQLLDTVEHNLRNIPSELLGCVKKRLAALRQAFADPGCRDAASLDQFPRALFGEEGPHVAWRSLGWGLIMSDSGLV